MLPGRRSILSYWVSASFQGRTVKLRGGKLRGGYGNFNQNTYGNSSPGTWNSSPEFPRRHLCFQDLVPAFITYTPEQQKRVMLKMFKMYLNAYGKKSASSVILTIIKKNHQHQHQHLLLHCTQHQRWCRPTGRKVSRLRIGIFNLFIESPAQIHKPTKPLYLCAYGSKFIELSKCLLPKSSKKIIGTSILRKSPKFLKL